MTTTTTSHVVRAHEFRLDCPPAEAFPLFEPLGEKHWAEGWDPEFLHPATGEAREGAVFVTRAAGEPATVWMIALHRPEEGRVEYARITPGLRAARVRVRCRAADDGGTRVEVAYELTGLAPEGEALPERFADGAGFRAWIESSWKAPIDRHLAAGSAPR